MPEMARPGAAAPPAPAITTTILMPANDRIPREPLEAWAGRLVGKLDEAKRTVRATRRLAEKVGFVGNNAGLIAAHRGDMETAWRVTERQLWWHGRMARRSDRAEITAHGVQPWINLGRLESLTGRVREALSRFAGLASYPIADYLEMGCVRVTGPAWSGLLFSREQFLDYLKWMYVADSVKAMLLNRRFELVCPFAERYRRENHLCEEACVVAECRMGDIGRAVLRARMAAHESRGWSRAVFQLRLAEAYACGGETGHAAEILAQTAGVVRKASAELKAKPGTMPFIARLAGACFEVGLTDPAYAVARDVLEGARAADDEPVRIEMLRLLAVVSPEDERAGWEDSLSHAEETTEYARYRRGGPPPPNPVITGLYERLDEVFAN